VLPPSVQILRFAEKRRYQPWAYGLTGVCHCSASLLLKNDDDSKKPKVISNYSDKNVVARKNQGLKGGGPIF
jgi:hypothetical protein